MKLDEGRLKISDFRTCEEGVKNLVWAGLPIVSGPRKLRQEDQKFRASLGHRLSSRPV